MQDYRNYTTESFATVSGRVEGCNFIECSFGPGQFTFDRCNLTRCTFSEGCVPTFVKSNVYFDAQHPAPDGTYTLSNMIDLDEEEEIQNES